MTRPILAGASLALLASLWPRPATSAEPSVICFGNEPSWSVAIEEPEWARLARPDEASIDFRGAFSRHEPLREWIWRGRPAAGDGGDLVVFLREETCSDGMSDVQHPFVVRASLASVSFAGCCRLVSPEAGGAAVSPIEGTTWRLTQLAGLDGALLAGVEGGVTLRLDGGQLAGFSGCNRMAGAYTLADGEITFGALAGTMRACGSPMTEVENAVRKALTGTLRVVVAGNQLMLSTKTGAAPALVFVAEPASRLEGVVWKVTGYNDGRSAVVSPLAGTTLTLSFQDGAVVGNAGCNDFRAATVTVDGNRLTVGPVVATRKTCPGDGVMEQERAFLAALETATRWSIERDVLDVHRADGERVLMASRGDTSRE
jgi:heat shock protein HslJ